MRPIKICRRGAYRIGRDDLELFNQQTYPQTALKIEKHRSTDPEAEREES